MSGKDSSAPDVFRLADLTLDTGQRRAWRGKTEIELPKLSFNLLTALVEAAPNSLSIDELIDRVWDGAVVSTATVAKRVELVREALGDSSDQPRYIALVRGHGYRLIPEAEGASASITLSRTPLVVAIVALVTVIIAGALYFTGEDAPPPDKSIAVLPFVSMTADPEGEIFADGLTEELGHTLAKLGDLKVAGRTSSFHFKGKNEDLRTIGERLGVAHVLEGSVRQSDDQLRITAQLISTDDGFRLWSESYDRPLSDILQIQQDIAQSVAGKLQASLLNDKALVELTEAKVSPEAYALYLKAVSLSPYGKGRDLGEAQALIEQVAELAPDFAPGWNRLAAIHGRRLIYRDPGYALTPEESLRLFGNAVQKALAIDPDSGEAYANLGGAAWVFELDVTKAAPLIERALNLDPWNLEIVSFAADFAKYIGRLEDALDLEEVLLARDPLCDTCRANLARSYLYAGRFEDAEALYRTMQSMGSGGYHWHLGVVLLLQQQPDAALESFRQLEMRDFGRQLGETMALHDLGRAGDAGARILDLWALREGKPPLELPQALAYVGEIDIAFDFLRRSLPETTIELQTNFPHPLYDALREDPRWQNLMAQIGRAPAQLAKIPFSLDAVRERLSLGGV